MVYYVLEFQSGVNSGAVLPVAYTDRATAEAAYHTILSAAATSDVRKHGAMLCNEDMFIIKQDIYTHYEPEPEPNEPDNT